MTNWEEKRAELEREVLEAKQKVMRYERTLRPFRDITDSEYRQAKKRMIEAATEISQGDYEVNKPADPLADMSLEQLKELYEKEKAAYVGDGKTWGDEGFVARPTGDARELTKLMRIQTKIQALEAAEGAGE